MAQERISVKFISEKGAEAAYFAEQDEERLRELRKKVAQDANKKYAEKHKYHCFRCGTKSLVEIDQGHVKVDVCVNENCGAIHLDPGELQTILKNQRSLKAAKDAILSVFKK